MWRRSASAPTAVTIRATSSGGAVAEQAQVELDHVGVEDRHQRERARVAADVVERDPPAGRAQPGQRAQHRLRPLDQRPLGDLDDERRPGGREVGRVVVERARVGVEEQRERGTEPVLGGRAQRGVAGGEIERQQAVLAAGGGQQRLGAAVLGVAQQRLVAADRAVAQVDDRLEDRPQVQTLDRTEASHRAIQPDAGAPVHRTITAWPPVTRARRSRASSASSPATASRCSARRRRWRCRSCPRTCGSSAAPAGRRT